MTWQISQRHKRAILYQDDINPAKRAVDSALTPLHYEGVIDSGDYDTPIDMTPIRVDNAQFDGWRITANGFHYALGQPAGKEDGWVGFGGRQAQNWFQFRLSRLGYLKYSTREWGDIGGAATYNRVNLSDDVRTLTLDTTGASFNFRTISSWGGLWSTPGGGEVSVKWRLDGGKLKEYISLNQGGRDWIETNRPPSFYFPSTPLTDIYFGYAFELDVSDLPKWIKGGLEESLLDPDFDDDDGQSGIELRDSLDRLLGLLPVDDVIVVDDNDEEIARLRLRKRIYKENGTIWLLVGARADQLNALPDGTLIFDPTIDTDVQASGDDGYVNGLGQFFSGSTTVEVGYNSTVGVKDGFVVFTSGISGLAGATIDVSYIRAYVLPDVDVLAKIRAEDAESPVAPTTYGEYITKSGNLTTAGVDWDSLSGNGYKNSPSLNTVIQELADSYDPDAIGIYILDDGTPTSETNSTTLLSYDHATADPPALHIEYTVAGDTITPSGIASAEAFGTALLTQIVDVSSIASLEAFGSSQIDYILSPSAIVSAEAFGSAQVDLTISPTGIASAETFGTAQIDLTVSPSGIASLEAFGSTQVFSGEQILPAGIASLEAFGTAQVDLLLSPAGIASLEAFGTALVSSGVVTISPTGINSAETFGTVNVNAFFLALLYSINAGTQLPGVFSNWERPVLRENPDGTKAFSPWAINAWQMDKMLMADFAELQAQQGATLSSLETNDIDSRNVAKTYTTVILESAVNGGHQGVQALGVSVRFKVKVN